MGDLLTYSLEDFILFTPEALARQIQLYLQDLRPLVFVWIGIGIGLIGVLLRQVTWALRFTCVVLAMAWLFSGFGYITRSLVQLEPQSAPATWVFAVQAVLFFLTAFAPQNLVALSNRAPVRMRGLLIIAIAVLGIGTPSGIEPVPGIPIGGFGLLPSATAAASLGVLLLLNGRVRWILSAIPFCWSIVILTLYWNQEMSAAALLMPMAGVAAGLLMLSEAALRRQDETANDLFRSADKDSEADNRKDPPWN